MTMIIKKGNIVQRDNDQETTNKQLSISRCTRQDIVRSLMLMFMMQQKKMGIHGC